MEWQAVVLVMQILMLAVGWFLFQQAKGELSARAAETPVLGEVKALQRTVKQLLADLDTTSERASLHLETQCQQARELTVTLAEQIEALQEVYNRSLSLLESDGAGIAPPLTLVSEQNPSANRDARLTAREDTLFRADTADSIEAPPSAPPASSSAWEKRRARVFALADAGQASSAIARETGISEGEIETLLGLRVQRV